MSNGASRSVDSALQHDRLLGGLFSKHEKAFLIAVSARLPAYVVPNHLTIVGFVGAALTFFGLALSNLHQWGLGLAFLGLTLNWLGDSLDGTLARVRNIQRPRYGFYIDHVTDLASQVLIVIGLGLSPYMRLDCALLGLVGYLGLSVMSFVKLHVSRHMQITYFGIGPTEIRVLIGAGLVFAAFAEMPVLTTAVGTFGLFDAVAVLTLIFAFAAGLMMFMGDSRKLAVVDPPRHLTPQRIEMTEIDRG